ncbi:hypothetical protein Ancab_015463 [Ancistrocladus abbreviatus]
MGNCMETWRLNPKVEEDQRLEEGKQSGFVKNGLRVKIVLTKEELEWLILQLNNNNGGGKRLEDVLKEIERGRRETAEGGGGWKPSLECIMESPELLEMEKS